VPSKADLQSWLEKKRWGPAQAARYLHVNVRTIQRWLAGDRRIPDWLETIISR
jgi:hypothetical protein